ncbi:MAG: chemotaxis protein CheW [Methylococcales bacterium]|jgi:twitching motility protein PilI|nr:chemotaxis protein CheW [Methylococcales bacterium]MBT7408957.1 chemotaxis protein CheW [Methylococcales bacterium]
MSDDKTGQHPLKLLREIELRSRRFAVGLPQQEEMLKKWSGIGFSVDNYQLVAPLGDVSEILEYPTLSIVPGVKNWVKGVSNVRGNLLTIIDLQGYICGENTKINRRSRVLVIEKNSIQVGLLVSKMFGMKRFFDDYDEQLTSKYDGIVGDCVVGEIEVEDDLWGVFSMGELAQQNEFMQVSL